MQPEQENTKTDGPYKVHLENLFEGPMDVLIHLIRKNELDIYDIPIATITEQYLQYLEWMKMMNIDFAGEFIVMASTLAQIKSKMLLPVHDEDDQEDPRLEITKPILEYLQMKSAAEQLGERHYSRLRFRLSSFAFLFSIIGNIGYIGVGIFSADRDYDFLSVLGQGPHGLMSYLAFGGFTFGAFFMGWIIVLYDTNIPKILGIYGIFGPLSVSILNLIESTPLLEWFLLFSILIWVIPLSLIVFSIPKSHKFLEIPL